MIKTTITLFGYKIKQESLKTYAIWEIAIVSVLWIAFVILRYATPYMSHELFVELMIIITSGLLLDHYTISTLLKK